MGFLKGKQGKDLLIIGVIAFIGFKFMSFVGGGPTAKIQKTTI